jgi:hypothetical protein
VKNFVIKKITLILLLTFPLISENYSQSISGTEADNELRNLIDLSTAGLLKSGDIGISFQNMPKGVIITTAELGVIKNFNLGISYGASNLIGVGNPLWYKNPGYHIKIKLFTETRALPSFVLGFNSQGKGNFIDSLNRYEIKSQGIYAATIKNFKFLGYLSVHGNANYSLENKDGNKNINLSLGFEKTIGPTVSLILDYNFALNDNYAKSLGKGRGILNSGLRWSSAVGLTIGFDFRNLLKNKNLSNNVEISRALYIEFIGNLY